MDRRPHDDALVITLPISNYEVKRIMVDNGSFSSILFFFCFEGDRGRKITNIEVGCEPYGFCGESTQIAVIIQLSVYNTRESRMTNF